MTDPTAATTPTEFVEADGTRFAYRRLNAGAGVPLLFTQHFMGNLDTIDPAILDGFAATREVIWFDTAGVGSSTGEPKSTIADISADAATFAEALGLTRIDLLGHSMGGQVAQWLTYTHPRLVRKLILVGTSPRSGILTDPADNAAALFAAGPNTNDELWLPIFFGPSDTSQAAGRAYVARVRTRVDRDVPFSGDAVKSYSAARVEWGTPDEHGQDYLAQITAPTLVVNGSHDIVIPSVNSFTLQQKLPDAELVLYPDSGHGAHFQYPERFVATAVEFLDR
ncbi:alpha/beta fold hydrolase [Humibacter ginsenosidimutans]|uniref:Alpha/beta hydrolase n=1 Tax=Humibacter ginsenosidimutans TaxID=2599293 RepID=A0A5B8M739_9MICO|nr:alpha/beta hydrolase [Humibacter ginsenosidimutans]QDZ15485.1 alpha/beta hydrolase [Humibacter ginsenosidimutans]